jgi:hypothetical protein
LGLAFAELDVESALHAGGGKDSCVEVEKSEGGAEMEQRIIARSMDVEKAGTIAYRDPFNQDPDAAEADSNRGYYGGVSSTPVSPKTQCTPLQARRETLATTMAAATLGALATIAQTCASTSEEAPTLSASARGVAEHGYAVAPRAKSETVGHTTVDEDGAG